MTFEFGLEFFLRDNIGGKQNAQVIRSILVEAGSVGALNEGKDKTSLQGGGQGVWQDRPRTSTKATGSCNAFH